MDEPELYDFDTPDTDVPDDTSGEFGFGTDVPPEPSISFPPRTAHWRHTASGKTSAFELTPATGQVTPISWDYLSSSSEPIAPTAVAAFPPRNPMRIHGDRALDDNDLWDVATALHDVQPLAEEGPPAPGAADPAAFAHDLSQIRRDGLFGLELPRAGDDPALNAPSLRYGNSEHFPPASFFPQGEDASFYDADPHSPERILHDITHTNISQRGLDNYRSPERLGWFFRSLIVVLLAGSSIYIMQRTNAYRARPSVVFRNLMRDFSKPHVPSLEHPVTAGATLVRVQISDTLDAGSYIDAGMSPILSSGSSDDFSRPDAGTAQFHDDLDAGLISESAAAPVMAHVSEGIPVLNLSGMSEHIASPEKVVQSLLEQSIPLVEKPVETASLDLSHAEALLHDAKMVTKLRKSTVMIKRGDAIFSGFTLATNTIATSREALADGSITAMYGGEQKAGRMITYFPRKDVQYRVIEEQGSDIVLLVFTKPLFRARNVYAVSDDGLKPGQAMATCGHPNMVMDTTRAGVMSSEGAFHMVPSKHGMEGGYEGAPIINAEGMVVGMLIDGVPQLLTSVQLQHVRP